MEKRIYEYNLKLEGYQEIDLPENAEILDVQNNDGQIVLWALIEPDAKTEKRDFQIFGNGHSIYYDVGIDRKYLSTVQIDGSAWHVFLRLL